MKSPFKFLDSFTKEDRDIFFGRDREIEELYQKVFDSKLLLVYGISGTGKSSLIQCGLANKFRVTDWLPIVIRRGSNIIDSMATGIKSASLTPFQGNLKSPTEFKKSIRSLYLDYYKPVFFIFDQLEELFIFGTKEEDENFIGILKTLISSDIQSRFIFILREEYLGWLSTFEKSIPGFFNNRMRVEKMDIGNALSAIEGPCKVYNITVEEGFAENMIQKLCPPKESEIELTYLQVYLDKVFKLASEGKHNENDKIAFHISDLDKAGNVYDILGSFLDEQINQLPDPELAMTVLKAFVSARGTKRPANAEEVKEYALTTGKNIDEKSINDLLHSLVNLRILQDKDHTGRNELKHDALALKIYEKITLVEKELIEIRQLIENAHTNWEKRGVLISSEDLNYIAPYESRLYLPAEYGKLIEKSKKELIKVRHRRRNILSSAAIALIIILGGFTLWAVKERKNAIEKEKIANEERIKATASEKDAIKARDGAIESDKKAVASEKDALKARDAAKASEIRVIREKEITEIRERQARANNFNYLSKEIVTEDPTVALKLAEFALSLDPENKAIHNNLNRIYYDNSFYKIFFNNKSGGLTQISPDWKKIMSVNGRTARLTDINGNNSQTFIGHYANELIPNDIHRIKLNVFNEISSIAFSPDGNSVLTGSYDYTARLWDLSGNTLQIFKGHTNQIESVAISNDGKLILTGSWDGSARLWDLNGKCLQILDDHSGEVVSVTFSPDGQRVLTASADSTATLWDIKGTKLQKFKGHTGNIIRASFSPDGKRILTCSTDQTAKLWDLNGKTMKTFTGHSDNITSAAFSSDGKNIITGSSDKTARLWDLNGNTLQIFRGHPGTVRSVTFSPENDKIITSCLDGTLRIWDISLNTAKSLTDSTSSIKNVEFSHDGKSILTLSEDMTARLWDLDGNIIHYLPLISNTVALSPDGKDILTGRLAAQLLDWEGTPIQTFSGHSKFINSVTFSPDGENVLTGSMDKTARLWNIQGEFLRTFKGHTESISSVAFSPDGKTVLTGSLDKTAILWNLQGKAIQIFKGHTEVISSVVFSPDGKTILTGSLDKTARLWDLHGKTLQLFSGHTLAVNSVAFSPDSKSIITGSSDKTARLWDLMGNTLQILSGYKNSVVSVAFSPDGKTILAGTGENTVKFIPVKEPLASFIKKGSCEDLNAVQELKYGVIQAGMLSNEKDADRLLDGMKYCLSELKLNSDKKSDYLKDANILFDKLFSNISSITNRKSFISYGLDLFTFLPSKSVSDKIEKANRQFLSSSTKEEIKDAYDFYSSKCSDLDSIDIILKFPEYLMQISEKLLSADTSYRHIVSIDLSNLSWTLLQNRKFEASLESARLSLDADSSNQYLYVTLPLTLVLNNRFDEAKEIYLNYYKKFIFNTSISYKLFYSLDIAELERRGIIHPDYSRVKELLNN